MKRKRRMPEPVKVVVEFKFPKDFEKNKLDEGTHAMPKVASAPPVLPGEMKLNK